MCIYIYMYVCMCVCVCVCVYTYIYTYTHAHTHTRTHIHIHIRIYAIYCSGGSTSGRLPRARLSTDTENIISSSACDDMDRLQATHRRSEDTCRAVRTSIEKPLGGHI